MSGTTTKNILLIEEDQSTARIATRALEELGHECEVVVDGSAGIERAKSEIFDIVVVDLRARSKNGIDICRELRRWNQGLPLLVLSQNDEEIDKVVSYEVGADAFMLKPFSAKLFQARINALLRRAARTETISNIASSQNFIIGELEIDLERRRVLKNGKTISFSVSEFEVLAFLSENAGRPLTRDEILHQCWGDGSYVYGHSINTCVNRIRQKIESDTSNPLYIKTVRGFGYRFAEHDELVKLGLFPEGQSAA